MLLVKGITLVNILVILSYFYEYKYSKHFLYIFYILIRKILIIYIGEWWISKRNFNKTCTPMGTYILNCLTDTGIPIKLNTSVTLSGTRYKFVSVLVKFHSSLSFIPFSSQKNTVFSTLNLLTPITSVVQCEKLFEMSSR